ncbi:vitronectin b isoform X2 [Xiphias gladius]|uniref:vitronectin b isoform X2 n=1 Tax=Xiphias gladius TaxID=8245 RepID=UPI001A9884AF|nr:vitronectin b isoform X2 [Xiphias gladius]
MKPAVTLLGLVLLLDTTFAAEVARGDTFEEGAEVTETVTTPATTVGPTLDTDAAAAPLPTDAHQRPHHHGKPAPPVDPDAAACSGRPFDAFLQLKNGSTYAFRGEYFFELDDKSILPGYPRLIQDVWGISGPIDAAFTRINCQGKSYIFKGKKFWRFDGDVLDEGYPRDISVGFDGIPADIDAAFAVPAPSHSGVERAYFFKGDRYYHYEFKHQPSHEECVRMSMSTPSVLFTRYTDLFCDQTFGDLLTELYSYSIVSRPRMGPHFISRDWQGLRPQIDAAMVGRVYLSPKPTPSSPPVRRRSSRRRRPSKRNGRRGRQSRYVFDFWGYDDWYDYSDYNYNTESTTQEYKSTPVQNVYFFKRDKYYRVNLQTKRVDSANPPYPRSIAKYWLGCKHEETSDASGAEKR